MDQVESDFWRSFGPTPFCSSRATHSRLLRTMSEQCLTIYKGEDSITSLGKLCQ